MAEKVHKEKYFLKYCIRIIFLIGVKGLAFNNCEKMGSLSDKLYTSND